MLDEGLSHDDIVAAKQAAENANRSKSAFLANMSHELRTPLNAILGFSQMLQSEVFGPLGAPQYREYVNDIYDSGQYLLHIVNSILDLSRIEAGRLELSPECLDLASVVARSLRLIRTTAGEAGVSLHNIETAEPLQVMADAAALRQCLVNILSNAVKFTPAGGSITVRTIRAHDRASVCVTDTGIGMSAEELGRIGKPFERAKEAYKRDASGCGLGLAITRSLLEAHGGSLSIASKPAGGTSVTISLPIASSIGGAMIAE
jgi:two-component system cell cycle sensor histidine kinase PleC